MTDHLKQSLSEVEDFVNTDMHNVNLQRKCISWNILIRLPAPYLGKFLWKCIVGTTRRCNIHLETL